MSTILIIDDDQAICRTLELHFGMNQHQVYLAHNAEEGLQSAKHCSPDVILLDVRLGGTSGLEILPELKQTLPETPIIIMTAFHDMESTIEAMHKGADEYLHKPIDLDELNNAVSKALYYQQCHDNNIELKPVVPAHLNQDTMIGSSSAMKEIYKTIGRVARGQATVLITGDSGTGKELVAKAIHKAAGKSDSPFVAVNCAALVETLLESDMFGHEKGAFTGAIKTQLGKFALAENGTIFLDEIGELSPTMQAKLLRVLQEHEFTPVGATHSQTSNARIIAATNIDLNAAVKEKRFREDLLYRLQVVHIHIPPLSERKEDIPQLVETMLARVNKRLNTGIKRIAVDVMEKLYSYDWPGNVRELENILTKATALCAGDILTADLLPEHILQFQEPVLEPDILTSPAHASLEEIEKAHVARVLKTTGWHKGQTCEILGVSRPRLRRLIAQFELTTPDNLVTRETSVPDNEEGSSTTIPS